MLAVLGISTFESAQAVLLGEEIPYHTDEQGAFWVNPDE
jgi:hypothetical protein